MTLWPFKIVPLVVFFWLWHASAQLTVAVTGGWRGVLVPWCFWDVNTKCTVNPGPPLLIYDRCINGLKHTAWWLHGEHLWPLPHPLASTYVRTLHHNPTATLTFPSSSAPPPPSSFFSFFFLCLTTLSTFFFYSFSLCHFLFLSHLLIFSPFLLFSLF